MQVLVVGAGIVGLAVARAAACRGHDVIVAEATGGIGRRLLYEFCASHGVAHNKCGKLIVATDGAELAKVETLLEQGRKNGVEGLDMIGGNAARALETELACVGALSSPESGIIDSHGYMLALWGELEDRGGSIAFETSVERMSYAAPHCDEFASSPHATRAASPNGGANAFECPCPSDGYKQYVRP